jgi:DNA-binding NarL/FixJ family response regulator
MGATKLNVLIAHGEPLIQLGLESVLSRCEDLHVQILSSASFDVTVTDLEIGMELVRSTQRGSIGVVIVTNDESEVAIRGAVEAGIRGYLFSGSRPESVLHAVRRVGQGGTLIDPRALAKMVDSLRGDSLTNREIDVLRLIVLGRPNKAVAEQLGIAEGTVKCHVKQLMAKLNARTRTEVANIAQRRGLVPPEPREPRALGAQWIRTVSVTSTIGTGAR